ncbi:MAG: transglycosylase domain-containing protein [Anaeromyxobacter sp.]
MNLGQARAAVAAAGRQAVRAVRRAAAGLAPLAAWAWRRRLRLAALLVAALVAATCRDLRTDLAAPRPSTLLLDRRGAYLGELPGQGEALGYWPLPPEVPRRILAATLETEDRTFFEHAGVRPGALARAAWQDLRALRIVSGGSTIAMQTARLQSPGRRTLLRKAREAVEAVLLVRHHGHDAVLRHYLTLAPYGNNVRGVARAARLYFDKPVEDLSWLQAAYLAGLPQAPGLMNPREPAGLARGIRRAHRILRALHARGYLDDAELAQALQGDLGLAPRPRRDPAALHAVLALGEAALRDRRPERPIRTTTLDLEIEGKVARVLADNLAGLQAAGAGNTAALVLDPEDGAVLAHVGSADYFAEEARGGIDYARVRRSPGSALKPFIYALALESGRLTAASELEDTPMDFQWESGRSFLPENANHLFFGPMLLREALANSRNIPALRVTSEVGVPRVLDLLEAGGVAGISREPGRYGLGVAIGNLPVTLEEVAGLYAMLARGGTWLPLRTFADVPVPAGRRLLRQDVAGFTAQLLADPEARRPSFPPGSALDYDQAVAVKTGTSQGFRDAWAVAYSDRLVVAVWVGNHDWRRMNRVTGLTGAAGAAHAILDAVSPLRAPQRAPLLAFPMPAGWVARTVCALSGRLAGPHCPHARSEHFAPGTEPLERCPWHRQVPLDARNGLRAGAGCPARWVRRPVLLDLPARYASWAAGQRLEVAPLQESPLCPGPEQPPGVTILEPRPRARYLWDPDTPAEAATIRLQARATPAGEPVVWLVDGTPIATVGYPHEARWRPVPGRHVITAALAGRAVVSAPVTVVVED